MELWLLIMKNVLVADTVAVPPMYNTDELGAIPIPVLPLSCEVVVTARVPGAINVEDRLRVTAPVAADALI